MNFSFKLNKKMSYAVFKTGGKQYRVSEGDILDVEKLNLEEGAETSYDEVLLFNKGDRTTEGAPTVKGASVSAKVISQFRCKKIIAFKFKKRMGYHKTKGSRRHMTKLEITSIK